MTAVWDCPKGCLFEGDSHPSDSVALNLTDTSCGYRRSGHGPACGQPVAIAITISYCDEHQSCVHDPRCADCLRSSSDAGVCEQHAAHVRISPYWGNVVRLRTHPLVVAARQDGAA